MFFHVSLLLLNIYQEQVSIKHTTVPSLFVFLMKFDDKFGVRVVSNASVRPSTAVPYYVTTEVAKTLCPNLVKGNPFLPSLLTVFRFGTHLSM